MNLFLFCFLLISLCTFSPFSSPLIALYTGADGKGIVVDQKGTLEMFGKLYHPTWTRLAAPVQETLLIFFLSSLLIRPLLCSSLIPPSLLFLTIYSSLPSLFSLALLLSSLRALFFLSCSILVPWRVIRRLKRATSD